MSVNWLQTNGVIYLPVVVKGATRVVGNVRRGLPANTTHSPNAGTMLCQRRTTQNTIKSPICYLFYELFFCLSRPGDFWVRVHNRWHTVII